MWPFHHDGFPSAQAGPKRYPSLGNAGVRSEQTVMFLLMLDIGCEETDRNNSWARSAGNRKNLQDSSSSARTMSNHLLAENDVQTDHGSGTWQGGTWSLLVQVHVAPLTIDPTLLVQVRAVSPGPGERARQGMWRTATLLLAQRFIERARAEVTSWDLEVGHAYE